MAKVYKSSCYASKTYIERAHNSSCCHNFKHWWKFECGQDRKEKKCGLGFSFTIEWEVFQRSLLPALVTRQNYYRSVNGVESCEVVDAVVGYQDQRCQTFSSAQYEPLKNCMCGKYHQLMNWFFSSRLWWSVEQRSMAKQDFIVYDTHIS